MSFFSRTTKGEADVKLSSARNNPNWRVISIKNFGDVIYLPEEEADEIATRLRRAAIVVEQSADE